LEDPLAHAPDLAGDADVGGPLHGRVVAVAGEVELGVHRDDRAHALTLGGESRVLDRPLIGLLEPELQLQPAHSQRHLDRCRPVFLVLHLEALDAGEELRHSCGVVQHLPDELARCIELLRPFHLHGDRTSTVERLSSGDESSRHTRSAGLWLSVTIAPPAERSASWIAAQTAWIPAPPPSPIPFVPSDENGDGLSM